MKTEQIQAYLDRIGFHGALSADFRTLETLMECHLTSVPFENLDIWDLHRPVRLEPERLFEKIVAARRGGYCFELNGLFYELLRAAGFRVYPVAARILWRKTVRPPLTHRAAVVELDGKKLYCDVGFGGPGPQEPLFLCPGAVQQQEHGRFLLRSAGGELEICRLEGETPEPVLSFADRPFEEADFLPLNFYCSHSPDILFVRQRVVSLRTKDARYSISGDCLTLEDGSGRREEMLETSQALELALKQYFGISVRLPG
jgi:arylamine N-acetyltransferase